MKFIKNSICAPQGFLAAGVHAGVRANPSKFDLAVIASTVPAIAAGVFTVNKMKAAPVLLTQEHIQSGYLQAIVVNSGNANACTGELGIKHAKAMASTTAKGLNIPEAAIGVASTGVIGVTLPIDKVLNGINQATKQMASSAQKAALAILTTDTDVKEIAVECLIGGKIVKIGGIAKGSGMIHPNMATMLGFITTDAAISQPALQAALSSINQISFNMITVDGDSSTNDMVLMLANGLANNPEIKSLDEPDGRIFIQALKEVCIYLAKKIAEDGEGATKLLEIQVSGAKTTEEAQLAARAICRSPLVKSAIYGEDANWGRIAAAVGAAGVDLSCSKLSVSMGNIKLMQAGQSVYFDEMAAKTHLEEKIVAFQVNLGVGESNATAWGCDLTEGYVKINASYRS